MPRRGYYALLLGLLAPVVSLAEVTIQATGDRAVVQADGKPFAEYRGSFRHMPIIWPVIGPTGAAMTRQWPMGEPLPNEQIDHPHHHSLWFAHQDVNGRDFWHQPGLGLSTAEAAAMPEGQKNLQRHLSLKVTRPAGATAEIVTRTEWIGGPLGRVCEDQRTIVFGADEDYRWIDFTIVLRATDGDVTFGDIKDGTFAVRVAGPLKVDAGLGGTIVSSTGRRNNDAWARPAAWVDYHGPLDGETIGVAVMSHPTNFQHPCRWHVRTYGLFTANPFGESEFPPAELKQQAYTIPEGRELRLRYRVVLHRGETTTANIAQRYEAFAAD